MALNVEHYIKKKLGAQFYQQELNPPAPIDVIWHTYVNIS